jgi:hypothetical protein
MRHKLNTDDFKLTTGLGTQLDSGSWWAVYDSYELQGSEIVGKPYIDEEGSVIVWGYSPLEDKPDLFLKFARLYDKPDFEAAALDWCDRYGLPGGAGRKKKLRPPHIFLSEDKLPRRMPISAFREQAAEARRVLLIYEAVLNRDEKAALNLIHPEDLAHLRSRGFTKVELGREALALALRSASGIVNDVVHDYCAPQLISTGVNDLGVRSSWAFGNLLGAMYLQMYWLMASGENVARCEYCGQIISFARSHPEGRKRRRDKRFCDDACRQAHHRSKKKPEGAL